MKILSLDLGKNKTVGCDYERESGKHRFQTVFSARAGLAQLVKEVKPDRVVIEVCSIAGWVCDLLREMESKCRWPTRVTTPGGGGK